MNTDDHPLAQRMVTAGPYLVGRFSDVNIGHRSGFAPVPDTDPPGGHLVVVHVDPFGPSVIHHINAVDPASTGYLEPKDWDRGAVHPAGHP